MNESVPKLPSLPLHRDQRLGPGTFDRVSQIVSYDPETGELLRKVPAINLAVGERAGFFVEREGRRKVTIGGVIYDEDVVCYVLGTGKIPRGKIKHVNGDKADNRLENLRDLGADDDEARGVFEAFDGKWEVRLRTRGGNSRKLFGRFTDRETALAVAIKAGSLLGSGEDARRVSTLLGLTPKKSIVINDGEARYVTAKEAGLDANEDAQWLVCWVKETQKYLAEAEPKELAKYATLYGAYASLAAAQGAVRLSKYLQTLGILKGPARAAAGMVVVRRGKRVVPSVEGGLLKASQIHSISLWEGAKARWESGDDVVSEVVCRDGRIRWIIDYLPEAFPWTLPSGAALSAETLEQVEFFPSYVSIADGGAVAYSKQQTIWAIFDYHIKRKEGMGHVEALVEAGLRRWDPVALTWVNEIKQDASVDRLDGVMVLPEGDGTYFIRGLRKPSSEKLKDAVDYIGIESAKAALDLVESYRSLLADKDIFRVAPDEKGFSNRHDAALFYSGLLNLRRR